MRRERLSTPLCCVGVRLISRADDVFDGSLQFGQQALTFLALVRRVHIGFPHDWGGDFREAARRGLELPGACSRRPQRLCTGVDPRCKIQPMR